MRLFGKVDSAVNRFDRAQMMTPPFDLSWATTERAGLRGRVRVLARLGGEVDVSPRLNGRARVVPRLGGRVSVGMN